MEEVSSGGNSTRDRGVLVCPDIEAFKSSVDGSVITGRRALREHNKRHGVTNPADYSKHWADKAREREKMFGGDPSFDRNRRVDAVRGAIESNQRRR